MARTSNIVSGIHYLKMAQECFEDFKREHPGTRGANLFGIYNKKIQWILTDILLFPAFPEVVREGIRSEINSDVFAIPEIMDKVSKLWPEQRLIIEQIIDETIALRESEQKANEKGPA